MKGHTVPNTEFIQRFEKQNPYAAIAAAKAETLPDQAAIYAHLAVAYQLWRSKP